MISNLSKWALQKFYKTIMNTNAPDIFLWFFQIAQRNLFWKVHRENEFLRKFSPMVQESDTESPRDAGDYVGENRRDSLEMLLRQVSRKVARPCRMQSLQNFTIDHLNTKISG